MTVRKLDMFVKATTRKNENDENCLLRTELTPKNYFEVDRLQRQKYGSQVT